MPDRTLAARLSVLRRRHRQFAKNLLAQSGPVVARGCTAPPPDQRTMAAAEEASLRLAGHVVGHGWSLPPVQLRVKVDHSPTGRVVSLLAGDGSGSFIACRFNAPKGTTYASAAAAFVGAFDKARLIPVAGMRW